MSGNETLNTILQLTSELIKNGEKVNDDQEWHYQKFCVKANLIRQKALAEQA